MPVHHQEEQVISCALATGFGSFEERLDLGWVEKVLPPMRVGNVTLHITRYGKVTHWLAFLRWRWGFNRPLSTKYR